MFYVVTKTECSCEQSIVILQLFCSKWKIDLDYVMGVFFIKSLTNQLVSEHELFFYELSVHCLVIYRKRQKMS